VADTLEDLFARHLKEGDEDAAQELVRRARPKLLAAARRIVPAQDAEDVVHTAFLSLFHKRAGFDAPVMPWLVTAVVRIAYRHRARERRQLNVARRLARPAPAPTPAEGAAHAEELRRLRDGVDRLPDPYRDAVVLHYLEGLSTAEVGGLLGVSQDAVKKRLERGRRLLLGVLAPPIAYPFLAAWWCLADAAEATAGHLGVTAMKLKTATIVAGVAIAAGAAGMGVSASRYAMSSTARAPAPPERRATPEPRVEELLLEIEAGRGREAALRRELDAVRAAATERAAPGRAGTAASTEAAALPASVRDAATALSVGEAAVRAAEKAEDLLRVQYARPNLDDDAREALKELESHGEEGFRAILALLRSGRDGIWFERLLRETWRPGFEVHLMAFSRDPAVHTFGRWPALKALGAADTAGVRRFLLDLVATETDPGLFMSAADALGDLKEAAGATDVGEKLRRPGWEGVRPHLLGALGGMGGAEAKRILLEYIAEPDADDLFYAVAALQRIDPDAAALESARILEGPRRQKLAENLIPYFEGWARHGTSR
jgi:RNA polymerase sigma-70 factor (ECF subfamily)